MNVQRFFANCHTMAIHLVGFLAVKKRFNLIKKAFFHSFFLYLFHSPVYLTYFCGAVQLSLKSAEKNHGKYHS